MIILLFHFKYIYRKYIVLPVKTRHLKKRQETSVEIFTTDDRDKERGFVFNSCEYQV